MPANVWYEPTIGTYAALRRRGVTADRIAAQLDARRWRRWGYAIALHNGPLSRREQWFVARVHGGTNAVLTAFTAAEARGLTGWERDTAHVLAALGSNGSGRCPVPMKLHHTRNWARVRSYRSGPVQVAAQALVIAAATFPDPRPACGILAAGVQQRIVRADELATVLDVGTRVRHRALLRSAVADIAQGAEALSEIDGSLHLSQGRWWDDQARQNELVLADALVLRFPSAVVRMRPEVVLAQLHRALRL